MTFATDIWAVVPIKDVGDAKQRLSQFVPAQLRAGLVLAMFEDVLQALVPVSGLAGVIVATADRAASDIARRYSARVLADEAGGGHTAVISAVARLLAKEERGGMLQVPGDIPLATSDEIARILQAHNPPPGFTIVPSHDNRGSNAILVSPCDAVPLSFGDDSFYPHLNAARQKGIEPSILRLPGVGRDIDTPRDLCCFASIGSSTRTQAFLDDNRYTRWGDGSSRASIRSDSRTIR